MNITKLMVFALLAFLVHCASSAANEQKKEGESNESAPIQTIATCTVGTNLVGSCKIN
jgi:hypothetical protein